MGGARWARFGRARSEARSGRGWRDSAAGATAAAQGVPSVARAGVTATDVTPSGSDWRGGRAGPITVSIGGPASGVAGGRGDDLAVTQRQRSERSAVSSSSARAVHEGFAQRRPESEPAIPGHGKGRRLHASTSIGGPPRMTGSGGILPETEMVVMSATISLSLPRSRTTLP